jgi:hypothetical protein
VKAEISGRNCLFIEILGKEFPRHFLAHCYSTFINSHGGHSTEDKQEVAYVSGPLLKL